MNQQPENRLRDAENNNPNMNSSGDHQSAKVMQMYSEGSLPAIVKPKASMENVQQSNIRPMAVSTKVNATQPSRRSSGSYTTNKPMTSGEALATYRRVLTNYEQSEIRDYSSVYFVGPTARKINAAEGKGPNFGFDDDKGRYRCVKNDHIGYRYEVLKGLGKGSFGDVVKVMDHKTKSFLACKIIRNERRFHKQAQCEIKILDLLRRQDRKGTHNVIHMKDYFLFRGHLCITFQMMHCDLYSALKKDGFRGFQLPAVRSFGSSLITCLRVLKRSKIIHCDLKPENILMKTPDTTEIKVIDFGSSCFENEKVHSYIQSRFYRSPEVILGLGYGIPIDMWSLGCILAELYTGQPIFPGRDEKEQLLFQMEVLGVPPLTVIKTGKRSSIFFNDQGEPLQETDRKGRVRKPLSRPLKTAVPCDNEAFHDFLSKCFTWDPQERMKPREAAHHPFITGRPMEELNASTKRLSLDGSSRRRMSSRDSFAG
eukprot:m.335440 g.335440  ORF g.335440 m.335440 type:complete len:483 (-) comp17593_c0_seq1:1306-2754(-)